MVTCSLRGPPVCHWVHCNQSYRQFRDLPSLSNLASCITPRYPLLQQSCFVVNNCHMCDVTSTELFICLCFISGETAVRLACWRHLFPIAESVTLYYAYVQPNALFYLKLKNYLQYIALIHYKLS